MADFANFQTVPIAVKARRVWMDERIFIPGKGMTLVPKGCWIVELGGEEAGQGAMRLAVPDDVFREGYRPTDTRAEAVWKEKQSGVFNDWPDGMSPQ